MYGVQVIVFLLLSSGLLAIFGVRINDFFTAFYREKPVSLSDELDVLGGQARKGFFNRESYELEQILKTTGRADKFEKIKRVSILLGALGVLLALLLNNLMLAPVLAVGFALVPVWYIRSTAGAYKKHLNEELETAISTVTTSYLRVENIQQAVKENIPYMKEPIRQHFVDFITESELINANITSAVNSLKMKIPNRIFHEWCNTLIQCINDRTMKNTLPIIVQKFSDVRIVQADLESMLSQPRREALIMVVLVIANIPLLYVLNKDWFHTLLFTTPGKLALAVSTALIVFSITRIMKLSKPIEYEEGGL